MKVSFKNFTPFRDYSQNDTWLYDVHKESTLNIGFVKNHSFLKFTVLHKFLICCWKIKATHTSLGFKKKVQFEPHLRRHTGEKPYECDTCGKKFTSHKSLDTHKLLHSDDFKYFCPVRACFFSFENILVFNFSIDFSVIPLAQWGSGD